MRPGELVDERFEIERVAGSGAMGVVYRARDTRIDEPVALKVLLGAATVERALRFEREALALADLRHPGVVRYVAHGATKEGRLYLVMEWVEGVDLETRLASGPLSVLETVAFGARVAEAVGSAHARGMVHRDLKPGNLLLPGGEIEAAKIADFGLALFPGAARATESGATVGTPSYMAPEQARGQQGLDARADVFALGCILHECMTGTPAFSGHHAMAVLARIVFEDAPRLGAIRGDAPASLESLVAKMLAKDPGSRPADGAAVAAALAVIRDEIEGAGPVASASRSTGSSTRSSLTRGEQRLSCVVLARGPAGALPNPMGTTLDASIADLVRPPRAAIEAIEARGGSAMALADGAIAVTVPGALVATDHAALAAGCALALRAALPSWALAIAAGRRAAGAQRPFGEAIDRAVEAIRARRSLASTAQPIDIDGVTAGLLDLRFDVAAGDFGLELRGERHVAEAARTLLGRPTPFVGREREMVTLLGLIAECTDEPLSRAVLVTGPAGSGKSRLRHELMARVAARGGVEVWIARGDPTRVGASFGLLGPLVSRAARLLDGEPIELRREKLLGRVARNVAPDQARRVAEFLGEMVGTPFPDAGRVELHAARRDPRLLGDQMRRAWVDFVDAESRAGPLLMVLEDMHWGDQPSAEYVDTALRIHASRPIMALGFARLSVHDRMPKLWHERGLQEIRLGGLPRRAAERLVLEGLGERAAPGIATRLWERSAGNAFFLEELVRATAEGRGGDLPETIEAMVESRLDTLDPEDRRLLRAASVFGEVFWRGGLSALLGAFGGLDDRLDRLERQEWIARRPDAKFRGEQEYAFRHAIVREAAHGTLTDEDRALGHRLAGAWLEGAGEADASVIARHFELGEEGPSAARWYRRAAEQALEGDDLGIVIDRVDRAVALGASGEALGELALARTRAHTLRGERAEAEPWAYKAMAALPWGSGRWCAAVQQTIWAIDGRCDPARQVALGRELQDVAARGEITAELAIATAASADSLLFAGVHADARALHEAAEALAARLPGAPAVAAALLATRGLRAHFAGDPSLSRDLFVAAAAKLEEAGDRRQACLIRSNAACACNELGAYEDAVSLSRAVLADADRLGLSLVSAGALSNLGWALMRLGALEDARVALGRSIEGCVATDQRRIEGGTRALLATALWLGGDLEAAEAEARRAVEVFSPQPANLPPSLATLAGVLLAAGRVAEAMDHAGKAFELLESLELIEEGEAHVRLVYAEALHASGREAEARAAVARARDRLLARAARIGDEQGRAGFLARVPEHARTLDRADTWLAIAPAREPSPGT